MKYKIILVGSRVCLGLWAIAFVVQQDYKISMTNIKYNPELKTIKFDLSDEPLGEPFSILEHYKNEGNKKIILPHIGEVIIL